MADPPLHRPLAGQSRVLQGRVVPSCHRQPGPADRRRRPRRHRKDRRAFDGPAQLGGHPGRLPFHPVDGFRPADACRRRNGVHGARLHGVGGDRLCVGRIAPHPLDRQAAGRYQQPRPEGRSGLPLQSGAGARECREHRLVWRRARRARCVAQPLRRSALNHDRIDQTAENPADSPRVLRPDRDHLPDPGGCAALLCRQHQIG